MRQGEIWMVDLNPIRGSEQAGKRSVVIISGDMLNTHAAVVIACPLTSRIRNYHGDVILHLNKKNGLSLKSEILTFYIRSISKDRLTEKIGKITDEEFEQVKDCLG